MLKPLFISLFSLLVLPYLAAQKFYESAPINYYESEAVDKIAAYFSDEENFKNWQRSGDSGYLESFLDAFEIPSDSQTLVFSKTSLQASRIRPTNPRAIYFNDEIYVGWVPSGGILEISVPSPETGTNFYSLEMDVFPPKLVREDDNCLQCHGGSFTRDIPGHLVRSVYPDRTGQPIFKAGTRVVDQTTPIHQRWGGWLVDGAEFEHMGNRIYNETVQGADSGEDFTFDDVAYDGYPTDRGDVIAQLILNHQVHLHTLLADVVLATRRALHDQKIMDELLNRKEALSDSTRRRIKHACDKALAYMFFEDEAELPRLDYLASPFAATFHQRGPQDSKGRSLYQLRMNRRMFRYPFSYIVYTDAFNELPQEALDYIWPELEHILDPNFRHEDYPYLSQREKSAVKEILMETHPMAVKYWKN